MARSNQVSFGKLDFLYSKSRLLREVLGNSLLDKQERFFRRLLGRKDELNYGTRSTTLQEAERLVAELDEFAAWAEGVL